MIVANRGISSTGCGSPMAVYCPASRLCCPGLPRRYSVRCAAAKTSAAHWRFSTDALRAVRRPFRRLQRLSWRGRRYRNVDPPQLMGAWLTRAAKGGIWAPAGLSETGGSLYFSTGNTEGARSWGDGEGVFRVGRDHHTTGPRDFFAPSDWKQSTTTIWISAGSRRCRSRSQAPTCCGTRQGRQGVPARSHQPRRHWGRHGDRPSGARRHYHRTGQSIRCVTPRSVWVTYPARGAACPNGAYVGHRRARSDSGPQPQVVSGVVCAAGRSRCPDCHDHRRPLRSDSWAVGAEGDDRLHGFRGRTGEEIYAEAATGDGMTGLRHFATILVTARHIYIAGDRRIFFVYGPQQWAANAAVGARQQRR